MDLRFSPEENKFREELRTFFREKVPASIRTKAMENRHLDKEELVQSHKILHAKGLTVPHWPKEWGGADWTPQMMRVRPDGRPLMLVRVCWLLRTPLGVLLISQLKE